MIWNYDAYTTKLVGTIKGELYVVADPSELADKDELIQKMSEEVGILSEKEIRSLLFES